MQIRGGGRPMAILFEVSGELLNRPCGGRFGNIVESIADDELGVFPDYEAFCAGAH